MSQSPSYARALLPGIVLLVLLLVTVSSTSVAQPVLEVRFPDSAGEQLQQESDALSAEQVVSLLLEKGRLIHEGEDALEVAFGMMVIGPRAQPFDQVSAEPFMLEPGDHPLGEHVQAGPLVELLRQHYDENVFLPGSAFLPNASFRDLHLDDDQVALVLTLVPHAGMATAESRPVALVLETH